MLVDHEVIVVYGAATLMMRSLANAVPSWTVPLDTWRWTFTCGDAQVNITPGADELRALTEPVRRVFDLTTHRVHVDIRVAGHVRASVWAPLETGALTAAEALLGRPRPWVKASVELDGRTVSARVNVEMADDPPFTAATILQHCVGTSAEPLQTAPREAWWIDARVEDVLWPPRGCAAVCTAVEVCSLLAEDSLKVLEGRR